MKLPVLRSLSALALVAAVAAGCGDVPTAPAAAGARLDGSGAPLAATVTCVYYYGNDYDCTAQASGGTGTGYSFTWNGSAREYYDQGGTSKAYVACAKNYTSGYSSSGSLTAYGTVTDSSGASVYFSTSQSC